MTRALRRLASARPEDRDSVDAEAGPWSAGPGLVQQPVDSKCEAKTKSHSRTRMPVQFGQA